MGALGLAVLVNRSLHMQPIWVIELEEALDQNGLSLPGGFPAFWRPDQVDIERLSGEEKALRLQQLKARLDLNNLFTMPCPV